MSSSQEQLLAGLISELSETVGRLSAELAAETRRADVLLEEKLWNISLERERCAKIADEMAQRHGKDWGYHMAHAIAEAIRASNAAQQGEQSLTFWDNPPMGDPSNNLCDCERSHNGIGMGGRPCDCRAGDPPHVEPSAAESAKVVPLSGLVPWLRVLEDEKGTKPLTPRDAEVMGLLANAIDARLATEAHMVELARWVRENPTRSDCVMELAALVIETFGGGK